MGLIQLCVCNQCNDIITCYFIYWHFLIWTNSMFRFTFLFRFHLHIPHWKLITSPFDAVYHVCIYIYIYIHTLFSIIYQLFVVFVKFICMYITSHLFQLDSWFVLFDRVHLLFIHSFSHSFIRSFLPSFIHSFIHPSTHPSIHPFLGGGFKYFLF